VPRQEAAAGATKCCARRRRPRGWGGREQGMLVKFESAPARAPASSAGEGAGRPSRAVPGSMRRVAAWQWGAWDGGLGQGRRCEGERARGCLGPGVDGLEAPGRDLKSTSCPGQEGHIEQLHIELVGCQGAAAQTETDGRDRHQEGRAVSGAGCAGTGGRTVRRGALATGARCKEARLAAVRGGAKACCGCATCSRGGWAGAARQEGVCPAARVVWRGPFLGDLAL
jgi:hypothetical protein